ncbi:SAICAR synthase-like protein, partial [Aureobasidium sp. EXF-8846]
MARQKKVARSIVYAILENDGAKVRSLLSRIFAAIVSFFALYQLQLTRLRNDIFGQLREQWKVDDEYYKDSFGKKDSLKANGDMGFSGSTFYTTSDEAYLIKSLPRAFEYSFFRDEFLEPYYNHMMEHTTSMLIRITDFLEWSRFGIGGVLGTAPTHHIVMENLLIGKEKDETTKWQTWDLKPT